MNSFPWYATKKCYRTWSKWRYYLFRVTSSHICHVVISECRKLLRMAFESLLLLRSYVVLWKSVKSSKYLTCGHILTHTEGMVSYELFLAFLEGKKLKNIRETGLDASSNIILISGTVRRFVCNKFKLWNP